MKIYRSRRYSRSRPNPFRRVIVYGLVSVAILIIFAVWGLTLLANLSNFWDTVRGSPQTAPATDKTAPPPPRLDQLPAYTNKSKVTISGSAEPASTVTLFVNGKDTDEQIIGNDGQFGFRDLVLKEGTTSFFAKSKDTSGNESPQSNTVSVVYDRTPPKITISQPTDNSTSSSQFVTVAGKTEPKSFVTINGQQQIVGSDGSFTGLATLTQQGANVITVQSTDLAGNQAQAVINVTYSP